MPKIVRPIYIALIKMTEMSGVMCDRKGSIHAFKTKKEATGYFEGGYNRGHARGYEASMSACLNFIQFQPKIFEVKDIAEIAKILGTGPYHNNACHSVSGFMNVVTAEIVNPELENIYETGLTPRLISEETFDKAA